MVRIVITLLILKAQKKIMSPEPNIITDNFWTPLSERPLLISGPCSAESEEQVMKTAFGLQKTGKVKIFRAGMWKPRTRPGEFEGVGVEGLKWLKRVKTETGMLTAVEVANPQHVEAALTFGVDVLWIGARTVVNPFSIQELAEVLKGTGIPVMVKNPLTPDIKLWMGALERINKAGITKLAAVHRGFHYFQKSPYRNAPMWEIPIELKRLVPHLPLITDISHISGRRELLLEIAQKALDLETNGLMIESHYNPLVAMTDAAQQITPEALNDLMNNLKIREISGTIDFENKLEALRTEIDKLDGELLQLLAKRMEIVDEIGQYKRENNITILQLKRWQHIIDDRIAIGSNLGLDNRFLIQLLELVHEASIQRQTKIFKNPS
jgi:chorismate mutase